jgi:DNA-binding PadR family transcriptional regulator
MIIPIILRSPACPSIPAASCPLKPVELQLLLVLAEQESHGYGLVQAIAERTDGVVTLEPGNLYRVIKRLLADGLVAESERRPAPDLADERRRYYRLTALGARVAAEEVAPPAGARQLARRPRARAPVGHVSAARRSRRGRSARSRGCSPSSRTRSARASARTCASCSATSSAPRTPARPARAWRGCGCASSPLAPARRVLEHAEDAAPVAGPAIPFDTTRAVRSDGMLETLWTDLRFAGRMLRKSPVFTAVAVLCIALGSGAVTTIFSAANALMLRPAPGTRDPESLVRIERVRRDGTGGFPLRVVSVLRLRPRALAGAGRRGRVGEGLAHALRRRRGHGRLRQPGERQLLRGGRRASRARALLRPRGGAHADDAPGDRRLRVVLALAARRDSGAVGRAISVNGHPYTLVGVARSAFTGLDGPIRTDAWVPIMMQRQLMRRHTDVTTSSDPWLRLVGRLRDGVTREAAREELRTLTVARYGGEAGAGVVRAVRRHRRLAPHHAPHRREPHARQLPRPAARRRRARAADRERQRRLHALRARHRRRREMTVRAALGAGRLRLVRQLLTEILALFLVGGLGGVVLALQATAALERIRIPGVSVDLTLSLELSPDLRVLGFALVLSLVTGLVFGLAPALQAARKDISARLREDTSASAGARRSVMGNALGRRPARLLARAARGGRVVPARAAARRARGPRLRRGRRGGGHVQHRGRGATTATRRARS